MARPKKTEDATPSAIIIDEPIGWSENDVLRQFHDGQVVTNPKDIQRLIELGAKYLEIV